MGVMSLPSGSVAIGMALSRHRMQAGDSAPCPTRKGCNSAQRAAKLPSDTILLRAFCPRLFRFTTLATSG